MTLDEHATAARRDPRNGMPALIAALRNDADLKKQALSYLAEYERMERSGRLVACWISRTNQVTLKAALAEANQPAPDVPAGGVNVRSH